MGWNRLLGGLSRMGTAYLQHTQFVQTALAAGGSQRHELLQKYVESLSDTAFTGLKLTMLMLANNESDSQRKEEMQSLLRGVDGARAGEPKGAQLEAEADEPGEEESDPDAEMLTGWFDVKDEDGRMGLLLDYLMALDERKYSAFVEKLKIYRVRKLEIIRDHEANEINAWGSCFEDRMAYFQARERAGTKDPEWKRTYDELNGHLHFIDWTIQASEAAWELIAMRRGPA